MKIRRGIALLAVMITIVNYSSISFASEATRGYEEGVIGNLKSEKLISNEKQEKIDALYEERLKLCTNYEKNKKAMEKLDKKIEKLGAVEVTSKEVKEKMKVVTKEGIVVDERNPINVQVPKESYVKWTSTRRTVTYNGTQYEI